MLTLKDKKVYLLSSFMFFSGCMQSPTLPPLQRPEQWAIGINFDHNFYQVSSFVYRSEQPVDNFIFMLKQEDIRVIINLRSRDRDSEILKQYPFQLTHIPIHTWSLNKYQLLAVMQTIQQAQVNHQKVLIHCYHGSDRTGASIAMYRIIFENWTIQSALDEMKYGGYGYHSIWKNIENVFTEENVKWIREQLSNPS